MFSAILPMEISDALGEEVGLDFKRSARRPDGGAGHGHGAGRQGHPGAIPRPFALIQGICEQTQSEGGEADAGPLQVDIRVVE